MNFTQYRQTNPQNKVFEAFAIKDTEKVLMLIQKFINRKLKTRFLFVSKPEQFIVTRNGMHQKVDGYTFACAKKDYNYVQFRIDYKKGTVSGQIVGISFKYAGIKSKTDKLKTIYIPFDTSSGRMYSITEIMNVLYKQLDNEDYLKMSPIYVDSLINESVTFNYSNRLVEGRTSKLSPDEMTEYKKVIRFG